MPTNWETFPIKFEGGWRTDLGRLEQGFNAPGSATRLVNFEPSVRGGYSRIEGFDKFDDDDVDPLEDDPVIGVIVIDEATALARKGPNYYQSSGSGWTEIESVAVPGAARISFDFYNWDGDERVIIVDGFDDPVVYNTADDSMTFDTSAPADVTGATIVRVFKNHIFFAKDNLLTFTAPYTSNDYDTGEGAGEINVGGDITGLIVFREQLIIFTVNSIKRLSGNTSEDFVLQPITNNTGCLCQYTVQEVGGDIMYLGPDGVRWLSATERNEDFGLDRASANIQDEILNIINLNCNYTSLVIRSKNQYRLFTYVPTTSKSLSKGFISTKFSEQSVTNIAWAQTQGIKAYASHSRQFRDREIILFTSDDGYVYRMESGNSFDGANIKYSFETPYMPINDPRIRKTMYKHSLYLKSGGQFNLTCRIKFNYNPPGTIQPPAFELESSTTTAIYGTAIYGTSVYGSAVADTFVSQTVGSGFVVALRYEGEDTNPSFILTHAILEFSTNERR
jgi:hypothetical protein